MKRTDRPGMRVGARRALLLFLLLAGVSFTAAALQIKIASVAPADSPYGAALNRIAADWNRISNGQVQVITYQNGIAGNQSDMLRKIRIGQLQGGVFAATGIAPMVKQVLSVSVPFLIQSNGELSSVMQSLTPVLDQKLKQQGFKAIAWANAGWIYLFSRSAVIQPDQLRSMRLALPHDEQGMLAAFKALGYNPISLGIPETLTALNSGMVDAIPTSPLLAAGYQWFGVADHMLDLPIAPTLGCIVMDERAWRKIPVAFRKPFLEAAQAAALTLDSGLQSLQGRAIATMKQYGLHIEPVTSAERAAWTDEMSRHKKAVVASSFDKAMVATIEQDLKRFRRAD